ncbi:hypothetical protein V2J09_001376, partial [Rumex salicifolius]
FCASKRQVTVYCDVDGRGNIRDLNRDLRGSNSKRNNQAMGKKGWFSAVKKALSPDPREKKDQRNSKSKKKWFGKQKGADGIPISEDSIPVASNVPPTITPPPQHIVETKLPEVVERDEENKHAYSVALATAAAAEAAVAAAQAAAEVVRLATVPRYAGKSKEEIAAIKIQTAFRGYLARRALRALRGLVRLKSLIEGQSVKRQAATTLKCMQTLARLQSQIRSRRIRMTEENQALQRQLQQKHERELERLKMGEEWDDSMQSKEKIEANLQSKQEASLRRERALAYAYTHQARKNTKSTNPTFMDPNNPHWGWSWLERWMAARPWEARSNPSMTEKDFNDHASLKSAVSRTVSVMGDTNNTNKPNLTPNGQRLNRPPSRQSPSNPNNGRIKPGSPRNNNGWTVNVDDDSRSMMSIQSERHRRHSIAGSSVRDDESLASSPAIPSYMAATKSAKAKNKPASPLGNGGSSEKVSSMAGSAKKRLSFPGSPGGPRRHSVPGKIESTAS